MQTDFFAPTAAHTIRTNKSGSFANVTEFAQKYSKSPVQMQQVHAAHFEYIQDSPSKPIPNVDAVLTNNPALLLTVKTADCLPILLYHPSGIVGAIHAGRKSTELHILKKVLTFLKKEKNISKDISLWFGPAICESCYQIDRETDTHYNLIAENMNQAYSVFPQKDILVIVNGDCTQCLSDEYHSYRVEQKNVCMNFAGIALI